MKTATHSLPASFISYPIHTPVKNFISLPIIIFLASILLLAFGFWNIYNREYQSQTATVVKSNMYNSINDVAKSSKTLINQSVSLTEVGLVNVLSDTSFFVSDGNRVLLVIAPSNINIINQLSPSNSDIQQLLTLRGKILTLDKNTIKNYKLPGNASALIEKQKIYLELTEPPQVQFLDNDNSLTYLTDNI